MDRKHKAHVRDSGVVESLSAPYSEGDRRAFESLESPLDGIVEWLDKGALVDQSGDGLLLITCDNRQLSAFIRERLSGRPQSRQPIVVCSNTATSILAALSEQGAAAGQSRLVCVFDEADKTGDLATVADHLQTIASLADIDGVLVLLSCYRSDDAESFAGSMMLLAAAGAGLFPKTGYSNTYRLDGFQHDAFLHWLEQRPYRIRLAENRDLDDLEALEAACWSEVRRTSREGLEQRLKLYPRGQCVLEYRDKLVGAIYSQRIDAIDKLYGSTSADVGGLHRPQGGIAQLLAVNVLPAFQYLGLGDQLLEFMLQYCGCIGGVDKIVAVSLCKDYAKHRSVPMQDYIRQRDDKGLLLDPILCFHEFHGADITGLVPGYRPADEENRGNGVLVSYDPSSRRPASTRPGWDAGTPGLDGLDLESEELFALVEATVLAILGNERRAIYESDQALMAMGMDSLDLMRLQSQLSDKLGIDLQPAFFFRYSTVKAISHALYEMYRHAQPEASGGNATTAEFQRFEVAEPELQQVCAPELQDAIAIVGIGCRFPGGVDSADAFWRMLERGENAVSGMPDSRRSLAGIDDAAAVASRGGFVADVEAFDARFFGISPREADTLDPQQRLMLETAYEALENAGIAPADLRGDDVGVFAGLFTHDYQLLQIKLDAAAGDDPYFATGSANAVAAGRLAYVLGFQGPALTVDTACSSSLVAVHLACRSLLQGESSLALAGGANLVLSSELSRAFGEAGMLSPDGLCKTFDASADGYVRSEGCGVVVLKRLPDAIADGDRVIAVIRGSAINQDGASNGLTAPNQAAQEAVMRKALDDADVRPEQVSYIEAHGTGTVLGDPIEIEAIAQVYGGKSRSSTPLKLGSVKTNIGHAEAAAGIAGLIKVALSLQHEYLPAHLNYTKPNPHIDFDKIPAQVTSTGAAWDTGAAGVDGGQRLAGVSSFGFSGTNAHVIVAQAPRSQPAKQDTERGPFLLPLSARTLTAQRALAAKYLSQLSACPESDLGAVCYSAATGRNHYGERACLMASRMPELLAGLEALSKGEENARLVSASPPEALGRKLAFLFTGQGSQYVGMARSLYQSEPVFRAVMDECESHLSDVVQSPLLDVMFSGENAGSELHQTAYTQPTLFALEVALARLWMSWGVQPALLIGHSVGEYAAACIAGVMDLKDACRLIAERGRLMQQLPAGGAMAAVFASEETVREYLSAAEKTVAIAAVNGPENVVISGDGDQVDRLCRQFASNSIDSHRLQVSHAFHSALMEPMQARFREVAHSIKFKKPSIACVSNLTGDLAGADMCDPEYWVRHVREPVRFFDGMRQLQSSGVDVYLELGPKPILTGMGLQCLEDAARYQWLHSLGGAVADRETLLHSVAVLYAEGVEIDWKAFYGTRRRNKCVLPTYPFEKNNYWITQPATAQQRRHLVHQDSVTHPLLGRQLASALDQPQFETFFDFDNPVCFADHRVFGHAVVPAAAYLEMALAAGQHLHQHSAWRIKNAEFVAALPLTEGESRPIQSIFTPNDNAGNHELRIYSQSSGDAPGDWRMHSRLELAPLQEPVARTVDLADVQLRCNGELGVEYFYTHLSGRDYDYGPGFRAIKRIWRGSNEVFARIELPAAIAQDTDYALHPVLLDGCLQAALSLTESFTLVPVAIASAELRSCADREVWVHVQQQTATTQGLTVSFSMTRLNGELIAEFQGVRFAVTRASALLGGAGDGLDGMCYSVDWREKPIEKSAADAIELVAPERIAAQLTLTPRAGGLTAAAHALESLTVSYICSAVAGCGLPIKTGTTFTSDELAGKLGCSAEHRQQLDRLLKILVAAGVLQQSDVGWEVRTGFPQDRPEDRLESYRSEFPEIESELAFVSRCGARLDAILRGEEDVLQLLFPKGRLDQAADFYQNAAAFAQMNALMSNAIGAVIDSLTISTGRPLRVLELGAGTGGVTAHCLPILNGIHVEYTFTDLSSLFLNSARERFSDYGYMRYELLNIEESPAAQGFEPHQFDIVIAANVLHATRDLAQTLEHVRELMVSGGLLLLLEGSGACSWIDMIFGLTDGWWRFADRSLRPDHPLLSDKQWRLLLREQGFATPVTLCPEEDGGKMLFRQSLVVAAAAERKEPVDDQGKWLLFVDSQGLGDALATRFAENGDNAIRIFRGNAYRRIDERTYEISAESSEDYHRLLGDLQERSLAVHGVVFMWALDAPPVDELGVQGVAGWSACGHSALMYTVQSLVSAQLKAVPRLWLVTRAARAVSRCDSVSGLSQASLWGIGKVIDLEHPELQFSRIDLSAGSGSDAVDYLYKELISESRDGCVAYRGDERYVARLQHSGVDGSPLTHTPVHLDILQRGTLDGVQLAALESSSPADGEIQIAVHASGVNFRDVLNTLGHYPGDPGPLGDECAGVVTAVGPGVEAFSVGDRVMATLPGSFADVVTTDAALAARIPADLDFSQAATIPVVFMTAWHTLRGLADIKTGDRVLIHAATGGVGQAAVQIARHMGAEIYATASPGKWPVLEQLGVDHIFNSRSLDFADQIMERTGGKGVDLVLNCLAGDFISRSLSVLDERGCFIEIGKSGIWTEAQIHAIKPEVSYHVFDLLKVRAEQPDKITALLSELVIQLEQGVLEPLPYTQFELEDATTAFRFMQQARHTGKLVFTHQARPAAAAEVCADGLYLITGGLGGLGLLVARWLLDQGARHLLLIGRSEPSPQARQRIAEFTELGATVRVEQVDVCDAPSLAQAIDRNERADLPLRGLVHAVGVLDDGVLVQQTRERFERVMAPKVEGAWNLHQLTRNRTLDFFILFSSTASLLGTPGQANHAAANAFLDQLAHFRRARGLPGCSINWGAWSEVGAAAREAVAGQWLDRGIDTITPHQGMQAFAELFSSMPVQSGVVPINWPTYRSKLNVRDLQSFYEAFAEGDSDEATDSRVSEHEEDDADVLIGSARAGDSEALSLYLRRQICRVLRLNSGFEFSEQESLHALGMDSLTGIELCNRINTDLGVRLSLNQLFEAASLSRWSETLLDQMVLERVSTVNSLDEDSGFEEVTL